MKKLKYTIVLFLMITNVSFAQTKNNTNSDKVSAANEKNHLMPEKTSITTEEEYNYITKGYQIQLLSGLDIKKGYAVGNEILYVDGAYHIKLIPIYKVVNNENVLVGYVCNALSKVWNKTYWFGFPIGNKALLDKSFESIGSTLDKVMTLAVFKAFANHYLK
jgi:hypothetical protein